MRLIDADELICRMAKKLREAAPDGSHSMTNDFSEYNVHQIMCETIKECIEAVKEAETINEI